MEAEDPELRREVAVKVLLPNARNDKAVVARFVEEAQVQGQLEHPSICPIHVIGRDQDGSPYFAMKRVRGKTLSDVIEEYHGGGEINLTRLIEIFLKVCDAMGFAHSRGVIHRDLKPANVMVGDYGEVLVMDWGLAKIAGREDTREEGLAVQTDRSEQDSALKTMDGDVVGTPAYMPPEQASGKVAKMDERSDIYSLGAILYEILAGVAPFYGDPADVLFKVIKGKFNSPTEQGETSKAIPREMESVVLKAMATEKRDRYRNVKELRDDILAWTEGRTLQAAEYTSLERAAKWVMRNKALSAVIGVVTLAVLVVGGVFWWSAAAQKIAERVGKETGERVAKKEQAKAARAVVESDMAEARKHHASCEAAYRKAAAPKMVEMEVVPEAQSVAYCRAVEKGPMTSPGPYNENPPEPEWHKGPKPPPPVMVPVRELGIERLKEATDSGSLAVVFADRARARAKTENFTDLTSDCESLALRYRLTYARALAAAEDFEKAATELEGVPDGVPGKSEAIAYAKGLCPLSVTSEPAGAKVRLLFMPEESAKTEGPPVREGVAPVDWVGIPKGTYMLRFEKDGYAPVGYHLRLGRDLLPEAAHELAVLAGKDDAFAKLLGIERNRLSGSAPAHRRVHAAMPPVSKVPGGFVAIPAGSFLLGEDLKPVFLETFLASKTELSVGEWSDFLKEAGARKRARVGQLSIEKQFDLVWSLLCRAPGARGLPAATLSWDDSRAYMRWRESKGRASGAGQAMPLLPTEAMWEKAARGVDGRIFPWGNVYDGKKVNGADLRPVRMKSTTFATNYDPVDLDRGTSVYGLKHAGGNLWEWCLNLAQTYEIWRILKGGGYSNDASMLRLAGRFTLDPYTRIIFTGFRVFAPLVSG
ncbi:MAG: protein kinase domain-containing protein [Planctomycetota bacterium]